ncbi:heterokaryon incompatibility protein-domain-containing protein [Paraphoma chrysanthemicola]|uniref:Heterokaryon incompatibility protein-domain-containing protein n=1 Tax=Paraphoma chrysanthemicola TaxID=798071 RepID=A0A8K0VRT0_9PLEO|nr:heterokaryon incompatibility protein-domain-containing protein [Paraphoma chrysanthemicola]
MHSKGEENFYHPNYDNMAMFVSKPYGEPEHDVQGSICDRCYSLPWEDLVSPLCYLENPRYDLVLAKYDTLNPPNCRVCQLFDRVATTNRFTSLSVSLTQCVRPDSEPSIGALTLLQSKHHESTPHIIGVEMKREDDALRYLRRIYPRTVNIQLAKAWIKECVNRHGPLCNPPVSARPKHITNFIDCERRTIVTKSTECPYVALSYVWGKPSTAQTDAYLEPTIEDSITLTKALGIRYLWVDRYCIDQNDAQSKHEQIQQMGVIYSSALLTIIAAAGKGPSHGLPGVQYRPRMDTFAVRVRSVTLAVHPARSQINVDILASTWASRAWTFQECYLSRRRLFFTDTQAQFVCNSCFGPELDHSTSAFSGKSWEQVATELKNYREPHPLEVILPPDATNRHLGIMVPRWDVMIQATRYLEVYSRRNLSYGSDALNAIVGTLNTLQGRQVEIPLFHVWGMPVCPVDDAQTPLVCKVDKNGRLSRFTAVAIGLLWYHKRSDRRRWMFPSWSSLGWDGPISWQFNGMDEDDPRNNLRHYTHVNQRIVYFETSPTIESKSPGYSLLTNANFEGECRSKVLEMHAMTVNVRLAAWDGTDGYHFLRINIAIPFNTIIEMVVKPKWDLSPWNLRPQRKLKGIIFHSSWEKADIRDFRAKEDNPTLELTIPMMIVKETRRHTYERIGICWLPHSRTHKGLPVLFRYRDSLDQNAESFFGKMSMHDRFSKWKNRAKDAETAALGTSPVIDLNMWGRRVCKLEYFLLE